MTELSIAAQGVYDAYFSHWTVNPYEVSPEALAAVLRAAADQLSHPTSAHTLYALADELENVQ